MDQFNLVASFSTEDAAREAETRLQDLPVSITRRREDAVAALHGEMHEEMESTVVGPGNVGPFTKAQSRGIAKWVPIGAVVGAIIMVPIAALVWSSTLGFIMMAVIGAVAGATIGFVAGGAVNPQYHDEPRLDAEKGPTIGVHAAEREPLNRARGILEDLGALAIREIDSSGSPTGVSRESAKRPLRE